MSVYLKSTPGFYTGFQKVSLTGEPVFQKTVFIMLFKAAFLITVASVSSADKSLAELIIKFLVVLPFILSMGGGMKPGSLPWYAGMSVFSLLALIPSYMMDRHASLLFMIPAVYCMIRLHRASPHLLRNFGYLEKTPPATEAVWVLLAVMVFIPINYLALTRVAGLEFEFQRPAMYVSMCFLCLFDYGALFALVYGLFMRRLLKLGVSLPLVIILNVVFYFLNVCAEIVGKEDLLMAFSAIWATSILTQLVLGLAFYHCRSSRMVFIAYLLNYLFYKSFFMP